jgi:hypothetical protein
MRLEAQYQKILSVLHSVQVPKNLERRMLMKIKFLILTGVLLLLIAVAAACQPAPAPTAAPVETTPCPTAAPCPECPSCPTPEPPVVENVPYEELWANSGHNASDAEAFNHWNTEDPAAVPTMCAKCHTSEGYEEFTSTGTIANAIPAPAGTIQCVACHNETAAALDSVTFPSGIEITDTGPATRCMVCHQGLASKNTVDAALEKFGVTGDPDKVPEPVDGAQLGFMSNHYYPAGATLYGTEAKGGYEYDGKSYDGKFRHVEGIQDCLGCHNSHSLEVKLDTCKKCHEGVSTVEDLRNVRMQGSFVDYDGDGNVQEGIDGELKGLQEILYSGIQEYARDVVGTGIAYDQNAYPYFFTDADGDGTPDTNADGKRTAYSTWTARLVKAAYNYQSSVKDPGSFAHNAKYTIQLMHDSIVDLNDKLGTIDIASLHREDPGHFAGSTEPFRHWDAEGGIVPGECVKCHQDEGVPQFLANDANIAMPASNGFMCTTCHNEQAFPALYDVTEVTFPSGAKVTFGGTDADGKPIADPSNLCLLCHQGRSSTSIVNKSLVDKEPNTPDPGIRPQNIHYFAAGATLFGDEVQGAYQFEGQDYLGFNSSHPLNKCKDCHDVHALEVKIQSCTGCHSGSSDPQDPRTYRLDRTDYDGDGDTNEGISAEIDAFAERLYAAMQAYAVKIGTPILYDSHRYPYFFVDADGDGVADTGEKGPVSYNAWTPTLVKAAYNYQLYQKDPGAFTHNPKYVLQFLYDSIVALGGDVSGFTRPATPAE